MIPEDLSDTPEISSDLPEATGDLPEAPNDLYQVNNIHHKAKSDPYDINDILELSGN